MTDETRLRAVAKIMSDSSPDFVKAISELALQLATRTQTLPDERAAFVERMASSTFDRASAGAKAAGVLVTNEQIEELVGALMLSAMDMAAAFPMGGHA